MVDLSIIYSKTGKGLRARNASTAGISTKQLKVLSFIDGKSKAEAILTQSNEITEKELAATLSQLETDGFIRPLAKAQSNAEDWTLTSNFAPMVVEEFKNIDDIEAETLVKAKLEKQEAERIATEKAKEKIRWKAEINARKEAEAKEKAELAAKEKARLVQVRIAREAALTQKKRDEEQKKRDEEIRAKAKAENDAQSEAMRKEKAELKAREEAEQAVQAKIQVEQERLETERLKKAEEVRLEAERIAKAENEAQLDAARKVKAELKAQEASELERTKLAEKEKTDAEAKEAARLEMTRVVRKAEEERKIAEAAAKEARQEIKRQIKVEEQARIKAARKAKDEEEQARIDAETAKNNKIAQQASIQAEMDRHTLPPEDAKNIAEEAENKAETINQAEQASPEASPIVDNVADKIAEQQAEMQAEEQRQALIQQENIAEQEKQFVAQQALEKAEKIRAKNEVNEKAALDAKELAKQEMARIAREADELRRQADKPNLTKPTKNGRFEASRNAKLKKSKIQSQKNQSWQETLDQETISPVTIDPVTINPGTIDAEKETQKIATMPGRKAANEVYADEKQAKSPTKLQENSSEKPASKRPSIDLGLILSTSTKLLAKLVKTTLIYGFILALLLIGILHFVNISPLNAPIEKLATDSLGSPVHIAQVRASLWPQPHLMLANVTIGDSLKATSMQVIPEASTLFDDVQQVKSLTIQGLVIEQNNAKESLQLIQNMGKAQSIKVEQINLSDLSFKLKDLALGPFDGKLALNEAGELGSADLQSVDHTLTAQIKPQGENFELALTGAKWLLPLNPNIVFDELKASASLHQNQITFSQIDGAIFGGNINAKAVLDWSGDWHTTGKFSLTNANAPQLLKAFASKASIDGKANLSGDFSSQSTEALKLTNTPTITANIELKNGKINGVDLAHAVMTHGSASLAGRATNFDKFSANLHVKDGQYHYKQIALETSQFHANGTVEITQNQAISGRVNAVLNAQSRRLQANFSLSGTINNVKRQ